MAEFFTDSEVHDIVLPYAIKFANDISSYSTSVINAFYSHYTPKMYERQFGLYNMWQIDFAPIPDGYEVSITYSSAFFGASHNSDEAVFVGSFGVGYHGGPLAWGFPKAGVPQMQPSPWTLIETYFNNYSF